MKGRRRKREGRREILCRVRNREALSISVGGGAESILKQ